MNKLLDFYNNHKVWIWIVATIVTVVPFVVCFFGPMYFVDSAYYIAIAERISEGNTLYTDVCCGYSPIWFYIEAAFRRLFGVPLGCYWPYLILYDVFFASTAILLYKLIMQYTNNKLIAIFCAWLFLPLTYWQQAYSVMLEIPSVFFGLLACYGIVISKNRSCWNYLWVGAIACCAFLTKQFGAGFIAINLFQLLFIDRRDYKSIGLYLMGYCVPILLCWLIWKQDVWHIIGNGYGTKSAAEAGRDITFWYKSTDMLFHIWRFCGDACIAVLAGVCIAPYSQQQKRLPYYLLAILGILGFSLQFYFAGGRHYRVYLIPFAMILIAEMLAVQTPKWLTWAKYLTLFVTVIVSLYNSYRVMAFWNDDYTPQAIRHHTEEIKKYVPDGDILWPSQGCYFVLTFTTKTIMPNLSTIGYSFGPLGLNPEKAMQQARSAQWVVHDPTMLNEPYYYVTDSLNDYICQFPSVPLDEKGKVRLYKMSLDKTIVPIVKH